MPTAECLLETSSEPNIPVVPIKLKRRDDVVVVLHYVTRSPRANVDWTGWTFTAEVRTAGGVLKVTASVTHGGTNGKITILFPKVDTAALTPGDELVWDLQGVDTGGLHRTVAEGAALVTADVTV